MANENAVLYGNEELNEEFVDSFDFDELESKLESDLEEQLSDLDFLEKDKEMIANPDNLGKVVMNTAWEQFINQIGEVAGEDFIKANHGLTLDLRDESHIQTTENFAEGKIATHNTEINYQERYDDWQNNFQRNEDGSIKTNIDNRTGEEKTVLRSIPKNKSKRDENNYNKNYEAREYIDKDRPKGTKTVHKDHTIPAAEIIRDPEANAHLTREEQATFANSEKNLLDLDASANESKGDSKMTDWLDSERNGEKPADRFNINEEELRERDEIAREEYEKIKKEGEERSIKAGKKSQKEEAFRVGGKALRAAIMGLLAELVKDIFQKFISWLKSSKKSMETLIEHLKAAVHTFIVNLKRNLITAAKTIGTTIATAIIGPIVGTIKKAWMLLKQGATSIKEAVQYLRNPENKDKPLSIKIAQIGKIITTGLVAGGSIVLSEAIEKGLMTFPIFAIEIPIIGSLANIIGIFLGAVISGIIGAIVINLIDKFIANRQKAELVEAQIDTGNKILKTQEQIRIISEAKLERDKTNTVNTIKERHSAFADTLSEFIENIEENREKNHEINESINATFDDIDNLLNELEDA